MTDSTNSSRLGQCEVCGANIAKYTCPKCEVKTCCLKCVNIHKKELKCDGIRDPTKFITLDKMTNMDLLNDYRMMERINRAVEGLHKNKLPFEFVDGRRILPNRLYKLGTVLRNRKINIRFLPKNFQKRLKNRTFVHKYKEKVFWDIEWIFPQADNLAVFEHGCLEDVTLAKLTHKYIGAQSKYSDKLNFYQAAGLANIVFLLKAENIQNGKYYELDPGETVLENLTGKTIVEYPTILLVLKGHELMYDIVKFECMEETKETKSKTVNSGHEVLSHLLNEAKKENEVKSKNLLFVTEYSDVEMSDDEDNNK